MAEIAPKATSASDMGVEYVMNFAFGSAKDTLEAEKQLENLINALDAVGMRTEIRHGSEGKLLLFVRVRSTEKLLSEVYRSRVKDWLYDVRPTVPDKETRRSLDMEPLTEAERLRVVHAMLTLPNCQGGAGITPGKDQWTLVESIFPLHDQKFNKDWMKRWSTTWTLGPEELGNIRDMFGEKVAFYFAFLQSYFSFLMIAAALGAASWLILPQCSLVFAVANCLWSVIFVEYWTRQEVDLAIRWNVRHVSQLQSRRARFQPDTETEDPITGEIFKTFPARKRLMRQLLQAPFALGASVILSALFAIVFGIEVMFSEVYNGPFKSILVFTPTVILSVMVPILTTALSSIATRLTDFENYEHECSYEAAMTQKVFIFNFICSYVPVFLTAFVYVPFGATIVPRLDVFGLMAPSEGVIAENIPAFEIDPDRLRKQVVYFAVTQQLVNFATETIVPIFMRKIFKKAKEIQCKRTGKGTAYINDLPEEKAFLERVRNEAELDLYNVTDDLRQMCMQFGYLCLFSPVWPLAAVAYLINNWIELRSDSVKICFEMRRPVPDRVDSIGLWLTNLGFLTWLGSITSAALVYLFSTPSLGQSMPDVYTLVGVFGAIVFSEHIYIVARIAVRTALSKFESPGLIKRRQEKFLVKRRLLQESLSVNEETENSNDIAGSSSVEDDVEAFWSRQKGAKGAFEAGITIINNSKKAQ